MYDRYALYSQYVASYRGGVRVPLVTFMQVDSVTAQLAQAQRVNLQVPTPPPPHTIHHPVPSGIRTTCVACISVRGVVNTHHSVPSGILTNQIVCISVRGGGVSAQMRAEADDAATQAQQAALQMRAEVSERNFLDVNSLPFDIPMA